MTATPPPSPTRRFPRIPRGLVITLQLLLLAAVLWLAGSRVVGYWREYRAKALDVTLEWRWVLASGVLVLVTYGVLIQTWRAILGAWGARLPYWQSARIWTVSSLGRYLSSLVQVGAMGVMAQRAGINGTAAAGAAIVSTVANVATGLLIALATGWALVDQTHPGARLLGIAILVGCAIGLALIPFLPRALAIVERLTGRSFGVRSLPPKAVLYAGIGNVIAWVIYGIAFQLLSRGVLGVAMGSTASYVAVYALSYVFGYIMFFMPAGAVYREAAIVALMPAAGLANPLQAAILAIASRLWLTVLEIVPGLVFLALGARGRPPSPSDSQDAPS